MWWRGIYEISTDVEAPDEQTAVAKIAEKIRASNIESEVIAWPVTRTKENQDET